MTPEQQTELDSIAEGQNAIRALKAEIEAIREVVQIDQRRVKISIDANKSTIQVFAINPPQQTITISTNEIALEIVEQVLTEREQYVDAETLSLLNRASTLNTELNS